MAEPSMYWIDTKAGIARKEASNDDFLTTAKDMEKIEELQKPLLEEWQITITTLTYDEPLEKYNPKTEGGPPNIFQHVGRNITRQQDGCIHLSNYKIITKILQKNDVAKANPTSVHT